MSALMIFDAYRSSETRFTIFRYMQPLLLNKHCRIEKDLIATTIMLEQSQIFNTNYWIYVLSFPHENILSEFIH